MAFGPHNIPIVGPLFDNPNEEAKLKAMKAAGRAYQGMRKGAAQARFNSLANTMAAYQPANNALATLYGPANSIDPAMLMRNIYGEPAPTAPPYSDYTAGSVSMGPPRSPSPSPVSMGPAPQTPGSPGATSMGPQPSAMDAGPMAALSPAARVPYPTRSISNGGMRRPPDRY